MALPPFPQTVVGQGQGAPSPTQSATNGFDITPADADLAYSTRGLYIGTGGTVVVILANDTSALTFYNVPSGSILPLVCKRVTAATTASQIIGLY
jgi:hypothetical protein